MRQVFSYIIIFIFSFCPECVNNYLINYKSFFFFRDYDEFMNDLEEDKEYRQNVNIYKKPDVVPVDTNDMDDPNIPTITLEEMLDDLVLNDDNDIDMQ